MSILCVLHVFGLCCSRLDRAERLSVSNNCRYTEDTPKIHHRRYTLLSGARPKLKITPPPSPLPAGGTSMHPLWTGVASRAPSHLPAAAVPRWCVPPRQQ